MKYDLATMNETEKRELWEKLKKKELAAQVVAFYKAFGKITVELKND